MRNEVVLILDFGGQYKELIARRVRECNVYSVIKPYTTSIEENSPDRSDRDDFDRRPKQRLCGGFPAFVKGNSFR